MKVIVYKYKNTLKDIKLVRQKKAEGFTNDSEFNFVRLIFTNYEGMKKYKYFIENNKIKIGEYKPYQFKLYEANILPMIRCSHIRDISGCSWVKVEQDTYNLIQFDKESRCNIEIVLNYKNLIPIKKDNNAPFRIASFDIETYSDNHKTMPNSLNSKHVSNIISCIYYELGNIASELALKLHSI